MCGITGFLDPTRELGDEQLAAAVTAMAEALRHRGPDDSGIWTEAGSGIALGFRRLAILDLTPTGHQPMLSADGRYVIIFNGEVYNYAELRAELEADGHVFRGGSDTEVMLAGVLQWGLEAAVQRFNGMFALALWDRQERRLHLVRDRLGVKPLYYGWMGGIFLFGSELKALRCHPAFRGEIDRGSLALYLRHNYIPAPFSIYRDIHKLPPASILSLDGGAAEALPEPQRYWSARQAAEQGVAAPGSGSTAERIDGLDALLRQSVRQRMVADVPLGAFLSGGVDSSTIVALMQTQSGRPVKTFTIGFREAGFDEARYAAAVARHLGTDHTELYVTPEEARAVIPSLPAFYDEPFADISQIPTYLVSQLARRQVTVSLSGDGGDELFGGYDRYLQTQRLWNVCGWLPSGLRRGLADLGAAAVRLPKVGDRAAKLAEILPARSIDELYVGLLSYWRNPLQVLRRAGEPLTELRDTSGWPDLPHPIQRMMYIDLVSYLPDDILVKLDRASMAVGLEGRVPFLDDHRVVEYAWQTPINLMVRANRGKWILRQVLYRYVPPSLIERPKMGFAVPVGTWLRGPLREWTEELLGADRLDREGFFDPRLVRKMWSEHLSGRRDWKYHLWGLLMFQAWQQP